MKSQVTEVSLCVFDAYGTLFDVHSAVGQQAHSLGPQAKAISMLWRQKQLEYTWLRSLRGKYVDFAQVTAEALRNALQTHSISYGALEQRLRFRYPLFLSLNNGAMLDFAFVCHPFTQTTC